MGSNSSSGAAMLPPRRSRATAACASCSHRRKRAWRARGACALPLAVPSGSRAKQLPAAPGSPRPGNTSGEQRIPWSLPSPRTKIRSDTQNRVYVRANNYCWGRRKEPARRAGHSRSSEEARAASPRRRAHPLRVEERDYVPLDTETNIVDASTLGVYHSGGCTPVKASAVAPALAPPPRPRASASVSSACHFLTAS
jgi:hypothetical protein